MTVLTPLLLLLLLALPLVWWVGWPRLAWRRQRDRLSLLLRSAMLLLLVLAVAGLSVAQPASTLGVLFVVDASDSLGAAARSRQLAVIEQAIASRSPHDRWGVLVFGADAVLDQTLTTRSDMQPIRAQVNSGDTNIGNALNVALSAFPADVTPRIVLLSDGVETRGGALPVAERAAAGGVEIHVVPFPRSGASDARVSAVDLPRRVSEGQPFDVVVSVISDHEAAATLLLTRNDQLISETAIALRPGENRFTFTQQAERSGLLNYTAQIVLDDAYRQNDRLAAFTQVLGQPRVLLIHEDEAAAAALIDALTGSGIAVDARPPAALPADSAALAAYRAVVIVNVPAERFSQRQMERVASYVRDLGGGLVFVGGDRSYGLGGYAGTPIAEALPVEMTIRDEERIPQLTIAYLVDSSGSMAASADGVATYLELAQQAIILSLELLQPSDRAALSTFASDGQWLARFQNVEDRAALQAIVAGLQPGGGTDIRAGLRLIERDIVQEPAPLKHVILLTDGGANSTGLVSTAQRLFRDHGVTITTIGIGRDIPAFLEQMALVSGGRHYALSSVSQLPRIFAQDTLLATRSYLIEETVAPQVAARSPILEGVGQLPALDGYVATSLRDAAQLILSAGGAHDDPLLAQWQFGLGRAVAFTSDTTRRWASDWLAWPGFARFWGQAVAWTITRSGDEALTMHMAEQADGSVRVTLDARDAAGAFLNGVSFDGAVLLPDNTTQPLAFRQTNAGEYSASFTPPLEGAYFVSVAGRAPDGSTLNAREGWVRGYSREYIASDDGGLLQTIAAVTNGRDLSARPGDAFAAPLAPRQTVLPLAPWLLLLAALLLPLDIAVRRLLITPSDVARLRARLQPRHTTVPDERLAALRLARERARVAAEPMALPATPPPSAASDAAAPTVTAAAPAEGTVSVLLRRRRREDAALR